MSMRAIMGVIAVCSCVRSVILHSDNVALSGGSNMLVVGKVCCGNIILVEQKMSQC